MRSRSRGPLKVLYQSINQSINQSIFIYSEKENQNSKIYSDRNNNLHKAV